MTMAIRATIRPYSTAVAPRSRSRVLSARSIQPVWTATTIRSMRSFLPLPFGIPVRHPPERTGRPNAVLTSITLHLHRGLTQRAERLLFVSSVQPTRRPNGPTFAAVRAGSRGGAQLLLHTDLTYACGRCAGA